MKDKPKSKRIDKQLISTSVKRDGKRVVVNRRVFDLRPTDPGKIRGGSIAPSKKAKPRKFSVATTKPRSGPRPGGGYKTNYGL